METKRTIEFTQYLRPDGRKVRVTFAPTEAVDDEVFDMADSLAINGYEFEAEILRTGEVSFSCGKGEDVLAVAISNNGLEVIESVCGLVRHAHREMHALSRD